MEFYKSINEIEEKMTVEEIIQSILQCHGKRIDFIEWNSPNIDEHMKEEGVHVIITVDPETGFVYGGNVCLYYEWLWSRSGIVERGWIKWEAMMMAFIPTEEFLPRELSQSHSRSHLHSLIHWNHILIHIH